MRIIFLVLLQFIIFTINAQPTFQWAQGIGDADFDRGYSIAVDGLGNIYLTGGFSGTVDFDKGAAVANLVSAGGMDIYIAKYDKSGNYLWAKQIGSTGSDFGSAIVIDAFGNSYIAGGFNDEVDFDPSSGISNLIAIGTSNVFFTKFDKDGNLVWAKSIEKSYQSGNGGKAIALDDDGSVYVKGEFGATADFDPGAGIANLTATGNEGRRDVFFAKYDNDGNYIFAKSIGGPKWDESFTIVVDKFKNSYISGCFRDVADFDPGSGVSNLTSGTLYGTSYFAKYDSDGNYVWAKCIDSDSPNKSYSLAVDDLGNVYVTGELSTSAQYDFDPGPGVVTLSASGGSYDLFLAKYNANGEYLWAFNMGDFDWTIGFSVVLDEFANVYVAGMFSGVVDFDPGAGVAELESFNSTGLGADGDDIFFAKYDKDGNYVWAEKIVPDRNNDGNGAMCGAFDVAVKKENCTVNTYITGIYNGVENTLGLNAPGDFNFDSFFAKYSQPPSFNTSMDINVQTNTTITCYGYNNGELSVTASGTTAPYNYVWNNGQQGILASNLSAGSYTVIVTDGNGCSNSKQVNISEPTDITIITNIQPDTCFQSKGAISLSVTGGTSSYSYRWSTISTKQQIDDLSVGSYSVLVTDENGCTKEKNITINSINTSIANAGNDATISKGESTQLEGSGNGIYLWSPVDGLSCVDCINPIATPSLTTTYTLLVMDSNGCSASDEVTITVDIKCNENVFVPNAFSPNGDGNNDVLFVRNNCVQTMMLSIYSRWGEKVFESDDVTKGWDGSYNGELLDIGVYAYKIEAIVNNANVISNGSIHLIR